MEEDISMSFPTNSFDASADFHALNDQIWISNNDLGNLVPDAFNLSIGPSSSSVLRHNFLDFFDELNLNTAPMPLSNPGGGNIEPIVTLDNSEIKALSYPNNLYIPSTMDFDNSLQADLDSGTEPSHQQPTSQAEVSEDLEGMPQGHAVPKRYLPKIGKISANVFQKVQKEKSGGLEG